MPVLTSSTLQPPVIPGEIIIRLSAKGSNQVNRRSPSVPLTADVSGEMLEPAEGIGLQRIEKIFAKHDLPVRVARPLSPRSYAQTAETRPLHTDDFSARERRRMFADLYVLKTSEEADVETVFRLAHELRHETGGIIESAVPRRAALTYRRPSSTFYPHQWGLWRMGCEEAWKIQTGSEDIAIAVIDTGVDDHNALHPNLLAGFDHVTANIYNALKSLPAGWKFDPVPVRTSNSSLDDEKHGTHVAGIIGAQGDPDNGVAGVVWNCKILPMRCMARIVTSNGYSTGVGHPDDIANAIVQAAVEGVRVINISLGLAGVLQIDGTISGDPAIETAVQYAQEEGCLVVAAAGNEGTRWPYYPASFPDVMGVGAVDWEDRRPAFSNWGEQVDVVAPGVNILSTALANEFAMADGTSQAAPHVAGLAAMLFSQCPQASNEQVAQAICASSDRVSDNSPSSATGKHLYYGWGRVNARNALAEIEKVVAP